MSAQLAAARDGRSTVSIVEAPAGLGKSRVLEEAGVMAGRAGIRVGIGKAHEGDRIVPMGTLLDALFADAGGVLPTAAVPRLRSGPEQRYWLLQELEALLEREALAGPLLICLDDLQWADRGTAVAVRALPLRLSGLPIAWILALRTGEAGPELEAAMAALEAADAQRLSLEPLSDDAVAEVAADVLGGEPGPGVLALAARAHGSPFLLMELLLGLLEESMVEIEDGMLRLVKEGLPARVGQSMRVRLGRLSELARRAVHIAPALGHEFRFVDLASLLDAAPADLVPAVSELIDADLVMGRNDRLAFRHDLVREAVVGALPPGAWHSLQRQAAGVMLARGAPAVEVASNLLAGAVPGDEEAIGTLSQPSSSSVPPIRDRRRTLPGPRSSSPRPAMRCARAWRGTPRSFCTPQGG